MAGSSVIPLPIVVETVDFGAVSRLQAHCGTGARLSLRGGAAASCQSAARGSGRRSETQRAARAAQALARGGSTYQSRHPARSAARSPPPWDSGAASPYSVHRRPPEPQLWRENRFGSRHENVTPALPPPRASRWWSLGASGSAGVSGGGVRRVAARLSVLEYCTSCVWYGCVRVVVPYIAHSTYAIQN